MFADSPPQTTSVNEIHLPEGGYLRYTNKYPLDEEQPCVEEFVLVGVKYKIIIPKWRVFGFIISISFGKKLTHKGTSKRVIVKPGHITLVDEEELETKESSWFYPFRTEIFHDGERILRVRGDDL